MLNPDQRQLFSNAIHPPAGYRFCRGIGTTFSLDLLTLLITPLSLTLADIDDPDELLQDPITLLEGVRRHAERLTVFCQAGRIAIPRQVTASRMFQFLEDSIVEVKAPNGGVFHPKIWLLRYTCEGEAPLYRFLCLSRNLTFDTSWDLMLQLEGELAEHRTYAYARNHPLGDFIEQLPNLALQDVSSRIREDIELLQDEVRRVQFQPPDTFDDELDFLPSGIPGGRRSRRYRFDDRCSRMLVVSPFLSDGQLDAITKEDGQENILLSRVDSLDELTSNVRSRFSDIYVLDDNASPEEEDATESYQVGSEEPGKAEQPSGLHAKLFIMEAGWDAVWLLGSANATNAALGRRQHNVEFMVRLKGKKSKIGIDEVLGAEDDDLSLRSLLRTYTPPDGDVTPDANQERSERLADKVRTWLIASQCSIQIREKGPDAFDLEIKRTKTDEAPPPGMYTIRCWPVTLRPESAEPIDVNGSTDMVAAFSGLSMQSLTPFMAFDVTARVEDAEHTLRFVLKLPVTGMPAAREDHTVAAILSDRAQFLRYLRLLLADENDLFGNISTWVRTDGQGEWSSGAQGADMPLLEEMVRALSRHPEKIHRINDLVERLNKTPEGRALFPDGFDRLWDAITVARRERE